MATKATKAAVTDYDAIIVGGGHNGLVAAAYLARSGARTLMLEARPKTGGAATTEAPWPDAPGTRPHPSPDGPAPALSDASAVPELIVRGTKTDFAIHPESTGSAGRTKEHVVTGQQRF
jgi:thioredoxin reductase